MFEVKPNEKPSQAVRRKNEEMETELSDLRQVYTFLRLCPEQDALGVLTRIRAQSSSMTQRRRSQEMADSIRRRHLPRGPVLSHPARHGVGLDHYVTMAPPCYTLGSSNYGLDACLPPLNLLFRDVLAKKSDGTTTQ